MRCSPSCAVTCWAYQALELTIQLVGSVARRHVGFQSANPPPARYCSSGVWASFKMPLSKPIRLTTILNVEAGVMRVVQSPSLTSCLPVSASTMRVQSSVPSLGAATVCSGATGGGALTREASAGCSIRLSTATPIKPASATQRANRERLPENGERIRAMREAMLCRPAPPKASTAPCGWLWIFSCQQGGGVGLAFDGRASLQHGLVAGQFLGPAQVLAQLPHDGVEPKDGLQGHRRAHPLQIVAAPVGQFVGDDEALLACIELAQLQGQ